MVPRAIEASRQTHYHTHMVLAVTARAQLRRLTRESALIIMRENTDCLWLARALDADADACSLGCWLLKGQTGPWPCMRWLITHDGRTRAVTMYPLANRAGWRVVTSSDSVLAALTYASDVEQMPTVQAGEASIPGQTPRLEGLSQTPTPQRPRRRARTTTRALRDG
jgi:hypothetical protein